MANCKECVHKFVCETLKGKIENSWAETCVAYRHRETCVAVVRCKDCINYGVNKPGYGFCEDLAVMRKDCDFCSRGERKDNE